jgi:alpha-tubulin suppressor-like RCC1 family protein
MRPHRLRPTVVVSCCITLGGCAAHEAPVQPVSVAAQLVFAAQPSSVQAGAVISPPVQVTVEDANGHTVTNATTAVTVAIGTNAGGGTLSGSTTIDAAGGVATFSNLVIDQPGAGYTLTVSASGLTGATSNTFNVVVPVAATTELQGLSSGTLTCGITSSGAAYCWGLNTSGDMGNGTTSGGATSSSIPVAVTGGFSFASISAGVDHTCAITPAGAAYCWGIIAGSAFHPVGELATATPVAVQGALTFASISAGDADTCGVATGGAAYCWGINDFGQLGTGDTTASSTPVAVAGGLTFTSVAVGNSYGFACGLTTAGAAYCWGNNQFGELGDGTTVNRLTPVPVSGGLAFASISTGGVQTCAVTVAGVAYCWGYNGYGQLGNASSANSSTPVAVAGGLVFASVSAGGSQTCGLTPAGAAYCWGSNINGQLGDSTTVSSLVPVAVSGGLKFASVNSGTVGLAGPLGTATGFACGLSLTGTTYCWGDNANGQLGNGSTTNSATPVAIGGTGGGLHFKASHRQ